MRSGWYLVPSGESQCQLQWPPTSDTWRLARVNQQLPASIASWFLYHLVILEFLLRQWWLCRSLSVPDRGLFVNDQYLCVITGELFIRCLHCYCYSLQITTKKDNKITNLTPRAASLPGPGISYLMSATNSGCQSSAVYGSLAPPGRLGFYHLGY